MSTSSRSGPMGSGSFAARATAPATSRSSSPRRSDGPRSTIERRRARSASAARIEAPANARATSDATISTASCTNTPLGRWSTGRGVSSPARPTPASPTVTHVTDRGDRRHARSVSHGTDATGARPYGHDLERRRWRDAHGRDREAPDRGTDQRRRFGAERSRCGGSPRRGAPGAYTTAGWGGNGIVVIAVQALGKHASGLWGGRSRERPPAPFRG